MFCGLINQVDLKNAYICIVVEDIFQSDGSNCNLSAHAQVLSLLHNVSKGLESSNEDVCDVNKADWTEIIVDFMYLFLKISEEI